MGHSVPVVSDASKEIVWVVVRLDLYHGPLDPDSPERTITLREALPTREEAELEAARLNGLKDESRVKYFATPVKWFPEGRGVQVGY